MESALVRGEIQGEVRELIPKGYQSLLAWREYLYNGTHLGSYSLKKGLEGGEFYL